MKTLVVTSPMMRGAAAKLAQQRLRTNSWKTNFMQGALIDGEFGPATGRACIRAKYWLGYEADDQDPTYGEHLDAFLTASKPLPAKQKAARTARLKKAKEKPLREKAFDLAVKDLGQKEHPAGSNHCPISDAWGVQGPWCMMAVSTWYIRAGSKAFVAHRDWAFVPFFLAAAVDGRRGVALASLAHVQHGDACAFDWGGDNVADHVGLFDRWIEKGRTLATIEGNTSAEGSSGSQSNGGEVCRRTRSIDQVAKSRGHYGFVHVGR